MPRHEFGRQHVASPPAVKANFVLDIAVAYSWRSRTAAAIEVPVPHVVVTMPMSWGLVVLEHTISFQAA